MSKVKALVKGTKPSQHLQSEPQARTPDRRELLARPNQSAKRVDAVARVEAIATGVATSLGLEIVDIEWTGTGKNQLLRIYIDKPDGVTHTDCETVSHQVSDLIDADDPIPGAYELEVSSPGVERKLKKWSHWTRFVGSKVKVVLHEPVDDLKNFDGTIASAAEIPADPDSPPKQLISLDLPGGRAVTFAFANIDRANLKFEW